MSESEARATTSSVVYEPYGCYYYSPLTTHHSPLTTHYSLLTTHHSPLTTYYSLLRSTEYRSPTFGPMFKGRSVLTQVRPY